MKINGLHVASGTDDNGSRDLFFTERLMPFQSCVSRLQNPEVEGYWKALFSYLHY